MTDIALMISALSAAVEAINKETVERGACLARHIRDAALFLMTRETGKEEEIGIIEEAEGEDDEKKHAAPFPLTQFPRQVMAKKKHGCTQN